MSDLQHRLQSALGDAYRIERELGGGGMSRIFLATEMALHRSVVVKLLVPEMTSEVPAARFRREFEVTASLGQHPNILAVLSAGTNDGLLYFITPFIEGESLRHRLRRDGRLAVADAGRILLELAGALAYAHERGVVHRDLKPENVLLADGHAVLADFGISAVLQGARSPVQRPEAHGGHGVHGEHGTTSARPNGPPQMDPQEDRGGGSLSSGAHPGASVDAGGGGDAGGARLTEGGTAVGTPGYMSPEQAAGDAPVDGRSDIYALAVLGYEMLTGAPPFTGASAMAVMNAHLHETPKPLAALRPEVPRHMADALTRALAKRPEDRFQRAIEFHDALLPVFSSEGPAYGGRRRTRRRALVAGGILAAAALTAFVALRRHEAPALNPNLIAVAPFEALGTDLGVWREGLVDLLSTSLDGAGPLRTVPPSVVVRRTPEGRVDRAAARALGHVTNAGITIFGSIVSSGRDSVRVSATILETATGRSTEIQYRDEASRMDLVSDSLSFAILRELSRTRAIGATRRSAIGSSSLLAMKAYLQGEQAYRRSDFDSAAVHYERAVALDSNFAPALRHLSNALGWKLSPQLELSHDGYQFALMAGDRNRGLAPRESLLVAADSLFAALQLRKKSIPSDDELGMIDRLTRMLETGVRRFPDDPEMWFKYADVQYHFTHIAFPSRSSLRTAREGFERSITLDSAFAPAYLHQVELAAAEQDVAAIRQSTRAFLSLEPHDLHGESMRMVQRLVDSRAPRSAVVDSALQGTAPDVLQAVFGTMMPLMDSAETQVRMARSMFEGVVRRKAPPAQQRNARATLVASLLLRGHVAQALAAADSLQPWVVSEAALLRAVPGDSVARAFAPSLRGERGPARAGAAALFWAMSGDTASFGQLSRLISADRIPNFPRGVLPGLQALARRDTAAAIAALSVPDSSCIGWCWQARFPLAFLLSAKGRDGEAAALLDQDFMGMTSTRVLWMLERARVNERLGVHPKAIDSYLYVANAWRNADPVLRPYVDEARSALKRLNTDPGRG